VTYSTDKVFTAESMKSFSISTLRPGLAFSVVPSDRPLALLQEKNRSDHPMDGRTKDQKHWRQKLPLGESDSPNGCPRRQDWCRRTDQAGHPDTVSRQADERNADAR
jgi:hypothetical protein